MEKKKPTKEELTQAVLEFAQYLYTPIMGQNVYTPQMLYQNLLNLNVLPKKTDYDKIIKILENARDNASDIQGYSQFLENVNMTYKKTLEYYTNLLSFDMWWDVVESTTMTKADWNSKEYKADYKRFEKFIDNFNYKKEFRDVVANLLRREVYYMWFRQLGDNTNNPKYTLQIMPQDRYYMTGYWENGILTDFDMQYFLQPSVSLENYDPKFTELFHEVFTGDAYTRYNPANPLSKRDGSFATYIQLSPDDGSWTFKFDTSNFETTPYFTPYIKDSLYANDVQKLQRNKDMLSAIAILQGEIGMIDKSQSGNTQDQTAFTPKVLGEFMNIVKLAINNENIIPVAMPLDEVEWRQFQDNNSDMYSNAVKTVSGLGASANRIIYSSDRTSQAELQAQVMADYNIMNRLYPQFELFMNFFINKKMRKYHFKVHFTGCSQIFERQSRIDNIKTVMDIGFVPNNSYIASCLGIEPQDFNRMIMESKNSGMVDNLVSLSSIHTASGDGNGKRGRPLKKGTVKTEAREYDNSNKLK
jgi:hypothetical protein